MQKNFTQEKNSKITILFLESDPDDQNRLHLNMEYKQIRDNIFTSDYGQLINIVPIPFCSIDDLSREIKREEPKIVHFLWAWKRRR